MGGSTRPVSTTSDIKRPSVTTRVPRSRDSSNSVWLAHLLQGHFMKALPYVPLHSVRVCWVVPHEEDSEEKTHCSKTCRLAGDTFGFVWLLGLPMPSGRWAVKQVRLSGGKQHVGKSSMSEVLAKSPKNAMEPTERLRKSGSSMTRVVLRHGSVAGGPDASHACRWRALRRLRPPKSSLTPGPRTTRMREPR